MATRITIEVVTTPINVTTEVVGGNTVEVVAPIQGGSSQSSMQIYKGHGEPSTAPDNPTLGALYYDLDTYRVYLWNTETLSW